MKEIWKPVVGWEATHEVSSLGRVRSIDRQIVCKNGVVKLLKGRVLTPFHYKFEQQGYTRAYITIGANSEREVLLVHRLVADAFCEKPAGCTVVNHKDCNPENNMATNLEWTTHKANSDHARANNRYAKNQRRGSEKFFAKLSEEDVEQIILRLCAKEPQTKIAKDYCIAPPIVSNINRGVAWRHVRPKGCGSPPYHLRRAIAP